MGVNYLTIVVAAVAGMVIGALWYSPALFSKEWMRLLGLSAEDFHKKSKFTPPQAMAFEFVLLLITAYVLMQFSLALGITTASTALTLGFLLWLGFQAPILLTEVFFENRPFQLFLLNASERLLAILAMSFIIALWH